MDPALMFWKALWSCPSNFSMKFTRAGIIWLSLLLRKASMSPPSSGADEEALLVYLEKFLVSNSPKSSVILALVSSQACLIKYPLIWFFADSKKVAMRFM